MGTFLLEIESLRSINYAGIKRGRANPLERQAPPTYALGSEAKPVGWVPTPSHLDTEALAKSPEAPQPEGEALRKRCKRSQNFCE